MSKTKQSHKSLWASLAVLGACAACCAFPLIGMLSLGAAGTWLATYMSSERYVIATVASIATLVALIIVARKRTKRDSCNTKCTTDGSCCK